MAVIDSVFRVERWEVFAKQWYIYDRHNKLLAATTSPAATDAALRLLNLSVAVISNSNE